YSADMIHQEAMKWLDKQDGETPFFGVMTYTLPHAELVQPADSLLEGYKRKFFQDKTWGGQEGSRYNPTIHTHAQFAAMISRLDAYVGEIVAKLEEKGLADNTIVVFTSDNGPHEEGGADPQFFGRDGKLRGIKRSCHEGGIRVPFIVSWPGHIEAGSESDHQLAFYDVMPTLKEIVGEKSPEGEDGISFLPELLGAEQPRHEFLYWEFNETDQIGLRQGDWKLVVKKGVPELYNLAEDIHEDNNVAADHPELVSAMIEIIRAQHTDNPHFRVTVP
ncbi:MAG: sulfatase-like hydrolase/transferase, partial [Muribaculaceae bacterium]|nr:sulfatase-like hydrolase/transferase [Muribaculaceae bacterium]